MWYLYLPIFKTYTCIWKIWITYTQLYSAFTWSIFNKFAVFWSIYWWYLQWFLILWFLFITSSSIRGVSVISFGHRSWRSTYNSLVYLVYSLTTKLLEENIYSLNHAGYFVSPNLIVSHVPCELHARTRTHTHARMHARTHTHTHNLLKRVYTDLHLQTHGSRLYLQIRQNKHAFFSWRFNLRIYILRYIICYLDSSLPHASI